MPEKNVLNVSVYKEEEETFEPYYPSEKEQCLANSVFLKFREAAEERDKPLEIFDGVPLSEYVESSFRRYNTSIDEREDIEDWQARMHDPMTRNKQNALFGRVISSLPIGQVRPRGDKGTLAAAILDDIYQYSEEQDNYEMKMANLFLSAMTNGTAFLYEGHREKVKKRRKTYDEDGELKIEEDYDTKNILYAEVVPILEFYPSTIKVDTVEELPYCFRRQKISFSKFRQDYSEFEKAKYVTPYQNTDQTTESEPDYLRNISSDVEPGQVEVIKYYNQDTSEYVILANGIWLNPIGKGEDIAPLPYDHGELPFTEIKYELIQSGILYGKSFPHRVGSIQDVLNTLNNMLLDQAFLSIFPIIITNGADSIEDDWIRPGRRIPIDTQGLSINEVYSRLDMGVPSGFHQWITEYTRRVLEEASVDSVTQGVAGIGGRTTAQEIRVAAQGVAHMLGMFGRYVNTIVTKKCRLRCKNILQFWTDPDSPIEGLIDTEDFNYAFNSFERDGIILEDGTRGTRVIEMYRSKDELPTKAEVDARADAYEIDTGKKLELIAITPTAIRNLDFTTSYSVSETSEENRDVQLALELEKARVYLSFFPDMVNREELLANIAVKFGDDPMKVIMPQEQRQQMQEQMAQEEGEAGEGAGAGAGAESEQKRPLGVQPEGAEASNLIRSELGGQESPL